MDIFPLCSCNSGKYRYAINDARGIFVNYGCDKCYHEKIKGYRSDIFTDPNYPTTEPIEEE
jgi:hypothetical protein